MMITDWKSQLAVFCVDVPIKRLFISKDGSETVRLLHIQKVMGSRHGCIMVAYDILMTSHIKIL